jgi:hypothetical protein
MQKQISFFLPVEDWRRIQSEAARRRVPMTALCREWLRPALDALRPRTTGARGASGAD